MIKIWYPWQWIKNHEGWYVNYWIPGLMEMEDGANKSYEKVPWGAVGGRASSGVGWEWRPAQVTETSKPAHSWNRTNVGGEGSLVRQAWCDERNPQYPEIQLPWNWISSPGIFPAACFPTLSSTFTAHCSFPLEVEIPQGFESFK